MRHRLLWLNAALLAAVVFAGTALRDSWQRARQREDAMRKATVAAPAPPAVAPIDPVQPAKPQQYVEVAEKMLFVRDRNPTVILDPPPPPPPPKPVPPFPVAYGVMDLGGGPTAILAPKAGSAHKSYRVGETIGEFKLLAMNNNEIVFGWEDKKFKKTLEELKDRSAPAQEEKAAPAQAAAPQPAAVVPAKPGPGVDVGGGYKACVTGDPSPAGAVMDGLKKVVTSSPFGSSCRWEPVK